MLLKAADMLIRQNSFLFKMFLKLHTIKSNIDELLTINNSYSEVTNVKKFIVRTKETS